MSNNTTTNNGKLYLVPAPLDFHEQQTTELNQILPVQTINIAASLEYWISENAKTLRAYLKRIELHTALAYSMQQLKISQLPKQIHKKGDHDSHTAIDQQLGKQLLTPALAGNNIGLVSEAGMPAIADPGSSVVRLAHQLNIQVVPLVGPISLMMALAASGLNGQNFAFVGYLAQEQTNRIEQLKRLEVLARKHHQAQIFIETPYRNLSLVQSLLEQLQPDTSLSISCALTLPQHSTQTATIAQWRQKTDKLKQLLANKTPAVFIIN